MFTSSSFISLLSSILNNRVISFELFKIIYSFSLDRTLYLSESKFRVQLFFNLNISIPSFYIKSTLLNIISFFLKLSKEIYDKKYKKILYLNITKES